MSLRSIGWSSFQEQHFSSFDSSTFHPGRVTRESRNLYSVIGRHGEIYAELTGRFIYSAESRAAMPAVGDWVVYTLENGWEHALIHSVLPRRSFFSRKEAGGRTDEQVIAANIDTVFIVTGLDNNFNLRRIERYLTLTWESGASPVIVLNKSDVCADPAKCIAQVEAIAIDSPIHAVSAREGTGVNELSSYFARGKTGVLIGSSGVGKSTLINRLIGQDKIKTGDVRHGDSKGRHTTTHRELIPLSEGGAIIDSPGMRELQLWCGEEQISRSFADIEDLFSQCRFRNCTHRNEPGCAVRAALEAGTLEPKRLENYYRMQKEIRHLEGRRDQKARQREKMKWKKLSKVQRQMKKQHHLH